MSSLATEDRVDPAPNATSSPSLAPKVSWGAANHALKRATAEWALADLAGEVTRFHDDEVCLTHHDADVHTDREYIRAHGP